MAFGVFVSVFLLYLHLLFKQYFMKGEYIMTKHKCVCCFGKEESDLSVADSFLETEIIDFFFLLYNCITQQSPNNTNVKVLGLFESTD